MYYVKLEIADGITIRAKITDENVFTVCPNCGTEHPVDLADIVDEDGNLDLLGTRTLCLACSVAHLYPKEQNAGRELHFDRWEPDEKQFHRLLAYFKGNYEGCCCNYGADDGETRGALTLYERVRHLPLRHMKDDIQEHFAILFSRASGHPETVYGQELCDLINLTVCPDPPLEGE